MLSQQPLKFQTGIDTIWGTDGTLGGDRTQGANRTSGVGQTWGADGTWGSVGHSNVLSLKRSVAQKDLMIRRERAGAAYVGGFVGLGERGWRFEVWDELPL